MTTDNLPYASPDEFFAAVEARYERLSNRLKSIARQLHLHRERIALMNVGELGAVMNVAPSAIVRFAQSMGLSGYSEMKSLFRQELAEQIAPTDNYADRIRELSQATENTPNSDMVNEIIANNIQSLENLFSAKLMEELNAAVELMSKARSIWVMAAGRSFAAAAYLTYLTQHSDKHVHWLTGICFNLGEQLNAVGKDDVMIVISYAPYAETSLKTIELAHRQGAKIIAITDSHLSGVAKVATQVIEIHEHSSFGFRSLVNTICVVQSLFLLYASHTELTRTEPLH